MRGNGKEKLVGSYFIDVSVDSDGSVSCSAAISRPGDFFGFIFSGFLIHSQRFEIGVSKTAKRNPNDPKTGAKISAAPCDHFWIVYKIASSIYGSRAGRIYWKDRMFQWYVLCSTYVTHIGDAQRRMYVLLFINKFMSWLISPFAEKVSNANNDTMRVASREVFAKGKTTCYALWYLRYRSTDLSSRTANNCALCAQHSACHHCTRTSSLVHASDARWAHRRKR